MQGARRANIGGAKHSWAILALLVKRLRAAWPKVRIVYRGDSGFCRWKLQRWCERHGVDYIVGLAKNDRLNVLTGEHREAAATEVAKTGDKVRRFVELTYGARTWDRPRRVIGKIEHTLAGPTRATSSPRSRAIPRRCTSGCTVPEGTW